MRFVAVFRARGVEVKLFWDSKVYKPSAATRLLAENFPDPRGLDVLDLGTGSGVLAMLAARLGARRVVATDVSARALRTAKENLRLNGLDWIELRRGSLYEPVKGERFDLIVSNPPMTPSPNPLPRFTWGGPDGRKILDGVIIDAPNHLKPGGRLLIPSISLIGIGKTVNMLENQGFSVKVLGYDVHSFGKTLLSLKDYIDRLKDTDYLYDRFGRPCWRIVVFEASLRTRP